MTKQTKISGFDRFLIYLIQPFEYIFIINAILALGNWSKWWPQFFISVGIYFTLREFVWRLTNDRKPSC